MKEYVARDAIRKYLSLGVNCIDCEQDARRCMNFDTITRMDICLIIDDLPTADVVEVVHCKDCKWRPRNMGLDCHVEHLDFPYNADGNEVCPYSAGDPWYNEEPDPEGYCHLGKREEAEQ